MTQREFLNAVIEGRGSDEDVYNKAVDLLESLDKKNATRASKPSKKAVENAPLFAQIVNILEGAETPMTAKAVAEIVNDGLETPFSTQKISALLVQLTKAGEVVQSEEKKIKVYSVAN